MANGQQSGEISIVPMLLGAIFFVVAGFWLLINGRMSVLLALGITGIILATYMASRSAAICMTIVYLLFLGDIRRIWNWIYGFPDNDPLIIVGAFFAFFVAVPIFFRLRISDTVSKLCLGLLLVMLLQVFNPAQGGLLVGITGMIYLMTPVLWFWIGRTYGTEALLRTLLQKILVPAAMLASIYGYYQTTVGIPPWQSAWVAHVGTSYEALHLSHSIRAIGFSPSSSEYTNMLGMATIVALTGLIAGRKIMLIPVLVLLPSLFLGGSRGTFVRVLFAAAMCFAFAGQKKGLSTARLVSAVGLGACGLALVLSGYGNATEGKPKNAADAAIAHQVQGLSDPLHSTAVGHAGEIIRGASLGAQHPAGFGLGSTSIASKFSEGSDSDVIASEFDLTDAFIALGLPGGVLYLSFIVYMYRASVRYITFGPKDISLPVFGFLAAFLGDWLFPGEYGNGPILWLAAGCVVGAVIRADAAAKSEAVEAELAQNGLTVASAV
jgi:hypothetical protein